MSVLRTRVTAVWIGLVLATGVSTWVLTRDGIGPSVAVVATDLIAGAKVWFVAQDFMELRTAPRAARVVAGLWIVAAMALILGFWFATP